jgi:preprotein translocase subunit YajC
MPPLRRARTKAFGSLAVTSDNSKEMVEMIRTSIIACISALAALLTFFRPAYAEGAGGAGGEGGLITMILFILPMFFLFWFFILRPEKKRKQEHERMIANLKKGDEVLTIGGLFGTIVEVRDDRVTLEIAEKIRVKITPGSVSSLIEPEKTEG